MLCAYLTLIPDTIRFENPLGIQLGLLESLLSKADQEYLKVPLNRLLFPWMSRMFLAFAKDKLKNHLGLKISNFDCVILFFVLYF